MSLISRSALIEVMDRYYNESYESRLMTPNHAEAFWNIHQLVAKQPTVEAKPVVHGNWIEFDAEANEWSCSKCGHIWQLNDGTPEENCMNFCTKCGADMRGGKNE